MSNIEEENNIKSESGKNININLDMNNLNQYNFTDENNKLDEKELNNDFQNIIKIQKSINFVENPPKSENEINNISMNSNNLNTNNNVEEEEENNNIIHNNEDDNNENDDMNFEQESINKFNNENENNDDEELPLITLNFISVCQCCKKTFDNNIYKPYLLKCGHFFCIKCIKDFFADTDGIKCPSDGLIAKSLDELTLLNNLIPKDNIKENKRNIFPKNNITIDIPEDENNINKNQNSNNINDNDNDMDTINNNYNQNYCQIHKNQKLSHIICDSNEIICVYCAFESFKKNPKREIKEISTQISEFTNKINDIISINQNEVLNLHNALQKIKNNKETEEKAINTFFECLIDYIKEKQAEFIDKVNELFNNNTKRLGDKLEEVTQNIEKSEKIKNLIESFYEKEKNCENNIKENYNEILSKYLLFQQNMKLNKLNLILDEYKFKHVDEEQIAKNCQNLGEIFLVNKKSINQNNNEKNSFKNNYNKEINKQNIKKYIFGEKEEYRYSKPENQKEKISNIRGDKSFDNIKNSKFSYKTIENKSNSNYIILDNLSLNRNISNNSFLNKNKNISNLELNQDEEINNNYLNDKSTINREKNKKIKLDFKLKRKNTYTNNRNKNRNMLIKLSYNQHNYIDFPNYSTSLANNYFLNKIDKKAKERNNITVNNYEVHQTLKNSFNNNFNYGHSYNNSNYLNKIIDFNNIVLNGFNTSTNKTKTNRNKLSFINKKYNNIINYK